MAQWLFGTEFHCSEGVTAMSQRQYIGKLMIKFSLAECKAKATTMVSGQIADNDSPELIDPTFIGQLWEV